MSEPEIVVLREGSIPDLKPLRRRLMAAGLQAELVPPPADRNS